MVYDDQGHIVTNAHVVGDERTLRVTTANSEDELTARLVSSYPQQDLAVIKLDDVSKGLKAAKFGDSSKIEVGQLVLVMGSPLGLSSSVTQGIVSATGRTVTEGSANGGTGATIANMVQTSAAINPGNSGGALVNLDSRVIGITGRTVVDDDYRAAGVAVAQVQPGGAADRAGLEPGDVITRLGDTDITTITSLAEALAAEKPGERTTVTYTRDGSEKTVDVTLGEQ